MAEYIITEECFESNLGIRFVEGQKIEIADGDTTLDAIKGRMVRVGGPAPAKPMPLPVGAPLSDYNWDQHGREALLAACKALNAEGVNARSAKGEMAAALAAQFDSPDSMPMDVAKLLVIPEG
jgi:hypothetical protein